MLRLSRQWFKTFWESEWTKIWGWTKVAIGSFGALFAYVGNALHSPEVKMAIDSLHLDPKIMLGIAVLGFVTLASMEHDA